MSDQVMERDDGAHVIEASTPLQVVTERAAPTMVLTEARIGPPGAPGEIGPAGGTAFARVSDGALSALRIVWEDGAGVVRMLDYRDAEHINLLAGLTLTAAAAAGPVTVQRAGPVDDDAWSWVAGRVWLGADGIPTQTPPADGYDVLIGYAVSPTRLYLDIQDHINLE
ncbi:hypothetical protein [Azoarcus indigens]|nr:hypothetical protein [Azoarcus indigens]